MAYPPRDPLGLSFTKSLCPSLGYRGAAFSLCILGFCIWIPQDPLILKRRNLPNLPNKSPRCDVPASTPSASLLGVVAAHSRSLFALAVAQPLRHHSGVGLSTISATVAARPMFPDFPAPLPPLSDKTIPQQAQVVVRKPPPLNERKRRFQSLAFGLRKKCCRQPPMVANLPVRQRQEVPTDISPAV